MFICAYTVQLQYSAEIFVCKLASIRLKYTELTPAIELYGKNTIDMHMNLNFQKKIYRKRSRRKHVYSIVH